MDATIFIEIVWNFACSISIWFFKNVIREFWIIWFFTLFLVLQSWKMTIFAIFCQFKQLSQAISRKKIKIKKIAVQRFKKSLSRVSIPKIRVLAQILRPLNFFPQNLTWKLATFKMYGNSYIFCHTSLRKTTITLAWSAIAYFCKK